jgi:transketolase
MYSRDEAHEKKVGIVVTGSLLYNALKAAEELNGEGIGASVLHMPTIKPLDGEALKEFASEHGALVTVEEHSVVGGLAGAVSEHLAETVPTKTAKIGVQDRFGESGEPEELFVHFGMDTPSIVEAAKKVIE